MYDLSKKLISQLLYNVFIDAQWKFLSLARCSDMTAVNSVIQKIFWFLTQTMCRVFGEINGCKSCCNIFCRSVKEIF